MKNTNESKDTAINVRLSTSQKKKYMEEAKLCNMTLSNYVLHILQNKKITVIKNGEKIAQAMYTLFGLFFYRLLLDKLVYKSLI